MKKVLLGLVLVVTLTLSGCDQVEETVTDVQSKLTKVTEDLNTAVTTITELDEALESANETITSLQTTVTETETQLANLEDDLAALESEVALTNTKINNKFSRDSWTSRMVTYNPDYSTNNEEYCFGIYDTVDWSTLADDDYKTTKSGSTGLTFVVTILAVMEGPWSTEIYAKDSCGNYSEFILDSSPYGFYSVPAGMFEEGETYEVVLYKEIYFSIPQLGLLPLADMGDSGAYPTDLSGIVATKQD